MGTSSQISASPLAAAARPGLSRTDWGRLNRLLAQALELDPADHARWIAALPSDDGDLVPLLVDLLRRSESTRSGEQLITDAPRRQSASWSTANAGATDPVAREAPGRLVGPYRLLRELGHGGMGTVWLAERADGAFDRRVALKLPRAEWTDRGLAERMARERSALAALNHPSIAQLYDAGWAADGRPYLALEYVEGVPIDEWCRRETLDIRARVRLFIETVRAVAFAHAKLVVHRDLKPGNVFVTGEGRVKLLDFGIAKLIDAEQGTAEETALTRWSGRAMTLNYAAPEQVRGERMTTAADIYSLGVMLFELATGERPYRVARDSRSALEEAILQADPAAPSSAVADRALARALKGDLETIILKALCKRPEERYETAAAFADDLDRWLDGLPVHARRASRGYRTAMFVRRHRVPIGVGAALLFTVLVGASAALWQARTARQEAERASVIKEFVLSMIRQADPLASAATREADVALLTAAEQRVAGEMAGLPEVKIELRLAIAEAYSNRGALDRARDTLLTAIREGEQTLAPDHAALVLARVRVARWFMSELTPDVLGGLDRAIETARSMGSGGRRILIEGLIGRALVFTRTPEDVAEQSANDAREAYELARAHLEPGEPLSLEIACHMAWPGSTLNIDRLKIIETAYDAGRVHPKAGPNHPTLLRAQAILGYHLGRTGRTAEAMALISDAVAAAHTHYGQSRPAEEVLTAASLGYYGAGRLKEAAQAAHEALRIAQGRLKPEEPMLGLRRANAISGMIGSRQLDNVEELVSPGMPTFFRDSRAHEINQAWWAKTRAYVRLLQGGTQDAEAMLTETAATLRRISSEDRVPLGIPLGWTLRENGKFAASLQALQSVDVEKLGWQEMRQELFAQIAATRLALGDADGALLAANKAIGLGSAPRPVSPDTADAFVIRGRAYLALGRRADALEDLEKADSFWTEFDVSSPWAAEARYWLARVRIESGDTTDGAAMLKAAQARLAKSPMPSHRALAQSIVAR